MKTVRIIIAAIVLAYCALIYSGWGEKLNWNQKFILEVETPEGVLTSETVLQYRMSKFPKRLNKSKYSRSGLFGETPFLKLPNGRYLFALSLYGIFDVPHAYEEHFGLDENTNHFSDLFPKIARSDDEIEMFPFHMPILITFDDIDDPSTIRQINPAFLASEFGKGYKLKRFDVAVTDAPVTYGRIAQISDWMIYSNQSFNPVYKGINEQGKDVGTFNRSVLARTINCKLDGFLMSNLTYGMRTKGIFCSY